MPGGRFAEGACMQARQAVKCNVAVSISFHTAAQSFSQALLSHHAQQAHRCTRQRAWQGMAVMSSARAPCAA